MKAALLRNVILPAWQRAKGQNSLELLTHLERTQWLSRPALEELQWQRIGELIEHAYQHVPYYSDVMRRAGVDPRSITRDRSLAALPLLDRSTMTQQTSRLRATNFRPERFVANATGGSTGEPLRFFDDRDESGWFNAAVWRAQRWYDVDVGDRRAYLWGADFDVNQFRGLSGRLKASVLNMLMLPAWQLSEATADRFWNELAKYGPRLLVAYAGAADHWARLLGNERSPIDGLVAIVVSAETLSEEARQRIEGCFKVPVYNHYGGRDLKFVAQECPERSGLHISSEHVLVEIVKDGRALRPGQLGEIVLTRLDNFAMPFVRYRSGDLGVLSEGWCPCGRSLPLLERIEGRVQDAIVTSDGRVISGPFFAHMLKDCLDVREFQVQHRESKLLRILVVLAGATEFVSRARIERLVKKHIGADMDVVFEVCEAIPLTRSGKRRVVVSYLGRES